MAIVSKEEDVSDEIEFEIKSDLEKAEPANSRSILISANEHTIHIVRSVEDECNPGDGIDEMAVELEFEVNLNNS
ncbi:MAG: hypothetical protein IH946_10785 [Bacteroidetes bacterium]|nr:hypothetical protein [Bacteroidota bacterium]